LAVFLSTTVGYLRGGEERGKEQSGPQKREAI
jgi:hypothetical protein